MDPQRPPAGTGRTVPDVSTPRAAARRRALHALGGAGLLVAGCGGTELAGVGSGGTGQVATASFASGAITGFGSVIVNGIRWDDGAASVSDELGTGRANTELAIGMVVELEGSVDESAGTGVARSIRVLSELRGPVASIDRAAGRFVVLGTLVQVAAATAWDDAAGTAALAVGRSVEVWGHADRDTGLLRATRVDTSPAPGRPAVLRGAVSALDRAGGTLRVGGQPVDVRRVVAGTGQPAVSAVLAAIADGALVWVAAAAAPAPGAPWLVERIVAVAPAAALQSASVRIDGRVAALAAGPRFELAGVPVDAAGAEFRGGGPTALRAGLRVRVLGAASGGRVNARVVEIRAGDDAPEEDENEIRGTVVRVGANPTDFTLRDAAGRLFVVAAGQAQLVDGLQLAELRVGTRLEVRGRGSALLVATRIRADR